MKLFSIEHKENKHSITILGIKIQWRHKQASQQKCCVSVLKKEYDELLAYNKLILLGMFPGCSINDISKKIFSSYPKATGFLRDVQQCNLRLMKDFKKFCDNAEIKFWLHAGTLIGALRNDGFVQWDDDVDVAMTRADFELAKSLLKDNETLELCEYYNEQTCSRQYQLKYRQTNIPVFIDVVVYDMCNAVTPSEQNNFWLNYRKTRQSMLDRFHNQLGRPSIIDIGYYKVGLYSEEIKRKVDQLIDNAVLATAVPYDNLINEPSFFYSIQNYPFTYPIMKYNDLYPLRIIHFEDCEFYIPQNPEYYLMGYGNIYLPPKDIGENPHLYAFEKYKTDIEKFLEKTNEQNA